MRFISLFLAAFLASGLALAGDVKIATVDLSKLLKDYPGSQKAMDQLQEIQKKKNKELKPLYEDIQQLKDELNNSSSVFSKKERKDKEDLLNMKAQDFTRQQKEIDNELMVKENDLTQMVLGEIKVIIAGVAKDKGYDLVLDSEKTAYVKGGVDLTADVEKDPKFTADKADSK